MQEFVAFMRDQRRASPLTLDAYERDLLRFATGLSGAVDAELAGVTHDDVQRHVRALIDRGLAVATVRRAVYAISSFFGWAHRWDRVAVNPAARVTAPRRERVREVRALSKRERSLLLAGADELAKRSRRPLDQQAPLLVRLLLKTGLRRAEAVDLCWRDVDLEQREVLVRRGKGGKARRVPLEDEDLLARLTRLREARGIEVAVDDGTLERTVFVSAYGGRLSFSGFYRIFHRALTVAELRGRGITPHALRHTFGSVLCARGVPVAYVKDLLGHEDVGSTMVYVHSTPAALREAVRKLGD